MSKKNRFDWRQEVSNAKFEEEESFSEHCEAVDDAEKELMELSMHDYDYDDSHCSICRDVFCNGRCGEFDDDGSDYDDSFSPSCFWD